MSFHRLALCLALLAGACGSPRRSGRDAGGWPTPKTPGSFAKAKRLAGQVYAERRRTFYCDCDFDAARKVDRRRCGYKPMRDSLLARRVEWEHVVPAAAFGKHRACWTEKQCKAGNKRFGGRRCCELLDPQFRGMVSDLVNLVPAVGELNNLRRDFPFGEVPGEPREFGRCDFELDRARRVAEVSPRLRGDVARIWLYMALAYPRHLQLTKALTRRLRAWSKADPVDAWERRRNELVRRAQGTGNPLVR